MDNVLGSPIIFGSVGLAILLIVVIGAVATRYKVAGPNEAFIITGKNGKTQELDDQKVVMGGGVFVMPIVKQLHIMDLSARRIPVLVPKAMTKQGIRLSLEAVAIIKVGGTVEAVRAASQRFLTQQAQIEVFTNDVLTGALRSIVGELTVAQITNERTEFATKVRAVVEETLTAQGLTLDTFEIQDVTDDGTYLADLARPEAAATRRNAEIAEAEARRESEEARLQTEEKVAIAERTLALRQAEIQSETDKARVDAEAAGPMAEAARQREILAEQEQVAVRQAALTERQLETTVRKPADAERYRVEQEAEARRNSAVAEAEGQRQSRIALAEAENVSRIKLAEAAAVEVERSGTAEQVRREAIARAVEAEGRAEAAAIAATGQAEAESMQAKAEAYEKYGEAAVLDIVSKMLPAVAREVSAPMSQIDKLTVVSTDGAGALPKTVTNNMTQILDMVSGATGVDLAAMLAGSGKGDAKELPATEEPAATA